MEEDHIDLTDDCNSKLEGQNSTASQPIVRKKRKKKAFCWELFEENEAGTHSKCKYCGIVYQSHSKLDGISNLKTHYYQCEKYPPNIETKKQKLLVFQKTSKSDSGSVSNLVAIAFNKDVCRKALARMVIVDELTFRFVEGEGFRYFCSVMQPKFVVPSRITIARDVMQLYLEERKNLKAIFASSKQRVCLTTDTWSSIQNINYMALTAHYVDSEWKLQKRILNFVQVANHKGETIGKMIEACLLEWCIERVFTITVDNASSNDVAIAYMKKKLKTWKTAILDGEFLHMRCCAHIINLVVSDGLKELDNSIVAIRNCVRYVRSSPSRLVKFNNCVGQERIENGGSVILDVPTRWNSTYLMLESALNFKRAFERMEDEDGHYVNYFHENENGKRRVGPPKEEDWVKADRYMEFLKLFYQVTLKFSASLHVTSNVYFHELCLVHTHRMSRIRSKDKLLSEMAKGMKAKYDQYWGEPKKVNALLFIAVVLDPRFKMRYVKWCFQDIYDDHVDVYP